MTIPPSAPASFQALGELYETLRDMAIRDPLTGTYNRALLEDRLKQAIAEHRRTPSITAIMLVDLVRFKYVNDLLGHHNGDLVLQEGIVDRVFQCRRAMREGVSDRLLQHAANLVGEKIRQRGAQFNQQLVAGTIPDSPRAEPGQYLFGVDYTFHHRLPVSCRGFAHLSSAR